jgi:hypothetical protein
MDEQIRFFISLDQATNNLGWSLNMVKGLSSKPIKYGVHVTKASLPNGERYFEKYRFLKSLVSQLGKSNIKVSYIVLEEVPQSDTYSATRDTLNQLLGCLRMLGYQLDIPIETLNVKHWKARAGIRHKDRIRQKAEGMGRVKGLYNIEVESDDVSDAILIGVASVRDGLYEKIMQEEAKNAKIQKKNEKKSRVKNN